MRSDRGGRNRNRSSFAIAAQRARLRRHHRQGRERTCACHLRHGPTPLANRSGPRGSVPSRRSLARRRERNARAARPYGNPRWRSRPRPLSQRDHRTAQPGHCRPLPPQPHTHRRATPRDHAGRIPPPRGHRPATRQSLGRDSRLQQAQDARRGKPPPRLNKSRATSLSPRAPHTSSGRSGSPRNGGARCCNTEKPRPGKQAPPLAANAKKSSASR